MGKRIGVIKMACEEKKMKETLAKIIKAKANGPISDEMTNKFVELCYPQAVDIFENTDAGQGKYENSAAFAIVFFGVKHGVEGYSDINQRTYKFSDAEKRIMVDYMDEAMRQGITTQANQLVISQLFFNNVDSRRMWHVENLATEYQPDSTDRFLLSHINNEPARQAMLAKANRKIAGDRKALTEGAMEWE